MSQFDIDDLVASLSASAHIGQEALDLKALQAQLSQTLLSAFPVPINNQRGPDYAAHNTPTPSTPVGWGALSPRLHRRSISRDAAMQDAQAEPEWEWASENDGASAMSSSSSSSSSSTTQYFATPSSTLSPNHFAPPAQSYHTSYPSYAFEPQQAPTSTFAATDPFFAAVQMQQQQHTQPQRSSMFFSHPQSIPLDTRSRLVSMGEGTARFE